MSLGLLRVAGAALTYLVQGWLARLCGAEQFGIYAFGWSLVMFGATLANLGLRTVLMRFVPEYLEKDMREKAKGFLIFANASILTVAIGIALLATVIDVLFPSTLGILSGNNVLIYVTLLPVLAIMYFWIELAIPFGSAMLGYGMYGLGFTLLFGMAVGLAWIADVAVTAASVGIALGVALAVACAALIVTLSSRATFRRVWQVRASFDHRRWLALMPALFAASLFEVAQRHVHVMIAGGALDPADTGVIYAATRTALVFELLCSGYTALSTPLVARHFHAGNTTSLREECRRVAAALSLLGLAAVGAVLAVGDRVLALFGPGFAQGYPTLVGLTVAIAVRYALGPAVPLLLIANMPKALLLSMAASSILNGVISAVCLPRYGLGSAWIGPTAGLMAGTLIIAAGMWRRFGVVGVLGTRQVPQ